MLRIERELEEVTVFYRPNTMRAEELSRNPVANALAVTFLMQSEQVHTRRPMATNTMHHHNSCALAASCSMVASGDGHAPAASPASLTEAKQKGEASALTPCDQILITNLSLLHYLQVCL